MRAPESILLVFFGLVASGKSYLATAWAAQYALPCYNSDRVRKELAGIRPETKRKEQVDSGIYTPEFSRRTYDKLISLADDHFREDRSACVVLDGSYQSQAERDLLRQHFGDKVFVLFVHCTCSEQVVKKRLALRATDPTAVSDGNWEIYLAQKNRFQKLSAAENGIEIDTDAPLAELIGRVNDEIARVR